MDRETALRKLAELRPRGYADGLRTQSAGATSGGPAAVDPRPSFGLGLARGAHADDFRLAIRVQDEQLLGSARLAAVVEAVDGEAETVFIGMLQPFSSEVASPPSQRARPIAAGSSISLASVPSAGTLGCFVRDGGTTFLLSNNHVLTSHGTAPEGTAVVQPGGYDGGKAPEDHVAVVTRALPMDPHRFNVADCAIAEVDRALLPIDPVIPGVGKPASSSQEADLGMRLVKRGRTSNVTRGTVSGINVNAKFSWPNATMEMVGLIEIMAEAGDPHFGGPGDSGALVLSEPDLCPVGLLVGGNPTPDGRVVVYATPIDTVLRELNVSLV